MVTDIFSLQKKTEANLENFPRWEDTLKYLGSSLPSLLPLAVSEEIALHTGVLPPAGPGHHSILQGLPVLRLPSVFV